ncbi:gustatory receptor 68a-like [Anoplophora glabripennis]|uniref:gustatory receptor 68a-like n=1 Tax=Anoplophora glabripennis TaxID=217634 RepID=UPI0008739B40|nr:gustatory receptor 68a-like [Anoplophora glabripennis]
MIWLTAITFCCDSIVRETEELLTNCYMLEQTLPLHSKELEELDSLKMLIKNNRPKLTAAGFFEINRSTLLSLLSTTTTYFIVALQFNSL